MSHFPSSYNNANSQPSQRKYLNLNSFNHNSEPLNDLQQLYQNNEWQIKSLQISAHGKTGVLLIETDIGSFVLKCNNDSPIDEFFNILADAMHLSVVSMHIIACYEEFFKKLVFKIEKFCERDEILLARLKSRLDFPFYQLMHYIPSVSLAEIGRQRFIKHQLSEHKMQSIGMAIGFDLLTNNSDRFKLQNIWASTTDGNISNVLVHVPDHFKYKQSTIKDRQNVSVKLGGYVFIDHSGYLLDIESNQLARKNFDKYLGKVLQFQNEMIQYIRKQNIDHPQQLNGLIKQIQLFTKYRLGEKQLTFVIQGILYATKMFIEVYQAHVIQTILKDLHRPIKKEAEEKANNQQQKSSPAAKINKKLTYEQRQVNYWNQYWNKDLAKIKLKYLQEYHLKVSSIYATYSQIINAICDDVAKNMEKFQNEMKVLSNASFISGSKKHDLSQIGGSDRGISSAQSQKLNDVEDDQNLVSEQKSVHNTHRPENPDDNSTPLQVELKNGNIPVGIRRNKLKEKLESFQKRNYEDPTRNAANSMFQ